MAERIHCVCMIIDGSTATVLPELLLEKIKSIQTVVRDAGKTLKYMYGIYVGLTNWASPTNWADSHKLDQSHKLG